MIFFAAWRAAQPLTLTRYVDYIMAAQGFTQGSIKRHVMKLSSVMIVGFLAMTLGSLVEVFYLGMVGKLELAAIAFAFPLVMALNGITRGLGVGAASLIARSMGEGHREQAALLVTHCYLLIIGFAVSFSLAGQFLADDLFRLIGARGEVLALASGYAHIWLLGFPLMGFALASNGLIRAFGNATYPGYIMTIGPLVQVLLGPILIFGWFGLPAMGLQGAALTFVMSAFCQFLLALYWFLIKERLMRLTFEGLMASMTGILQVGIPASATNLIQPVSAVVVTWLLAGYGVSVVAGFGVASRIESVVGMVVIGISTSVVPLVGQNWGAYQFDRVREALNTCYQACLAWGVVAAIIMWLGAPFFVSLINADPDLVESAVMFLYIIPISIGFMGMLTVSTHCFNALRRPGPALLLSLARLLVIYIPLALLGSHYWGYVGVFVATAATNVLVGVLGYAWNRKVLATEQASMIASRALSL
ncbi:MAG: MATE family efflux transporter [SAR86 cluster bacterium]|uniref:MATE family efflux transporter n=1 Tax=SAR86 cluster bacterium TaxID=2030880 RepID=A0A972W090_9GAMM|nr:MATE family efflux transporter [SAR86 cluster bacterium]